MELKSNIMFSFIHKIKQWYKHQKLIKQSVLIPITSYDQYAALVKEAKDNSKNKVFSNLLYAACRNQKIDSPQKVL